MEFEAIKTYAHDSAQTAMDAYARSIMERDAVDYSEALVRAARENPDVARRYDYEVLGGDQANLIYRENSTSRVFSMSPSDAGEKLDSLAQAEIRQSGGSVTYTEALEKVMAANPELTRCYGQS
jgi:hypothetical protein